MLLTAHKILITAGLVLATVMVAWGAVHALGRGEPGAWVVFALGVVAVPAALLYLRKLRVNPPIR
jgi:hypothetical protein